MLLLFGRRRYCAPAAIRIHDLLQRLTGGCWPRRYHFADWLWNEAGYPFGYHDSDSAQVGPDLPKVLTGR